MFTTRGTSKVLLRSTFSAKNQQIDLKRKKPLYSPCYNPLFYIITIPSEAFFISIDEFVDTCSVPCRVFLFDSLLLHGLLLVLVHPTLNLWVRQLTTDFVIPFCTPHTMNTHEFHYPKHFLALKTK